MKMGNILLVCFLATYPLGYLVAAATENPAVPAALDYLWAFLNSPFGLSVLGGLGMFTLAKLATAKPAWIALYQAHKATLWEAVRFAERAIPDGVENKSMKRADAALKFLLEYEPSLTKVGEESLRRALNAAHSNQQTKNIDTTDAEALRDRLLLPVVALCCVLFFGACATPADTYVRADAAAWKVYDEDDLLDKWIAGAVERGEITPGEAGDLRQLNAARKTRIAKALASLEEGK